MPVIPEHASHKFSKPNHMASAAKLKSNVSEASKFGGLVSIGRQFSDSSSRPRRQSERPDSSLLKEAMTERACSDLTMCADVAQ